MAGFYNSDSSFNMFDFFKIKIEKSKCGCIIDLYNWLDDHGIFIITKKNKRWRKIICDRTGKWWKYPLPDLKEIK